MTQRIVNAVQSAEQLLRRRMVVITYTVRLAMYTCAGFVRSTLTPVSSAITICPNSMGTLDCHRNSKTAYLSYCEDLHNSNDNYTCS